MENIERAKELAIERHGGEVRPNLGREPKINHIEEVARLVRESGGSESEEASAWLHDIVEDTDTTIEEILELFGKEIAELVDGLTDPPEFSAMPLALRKSQQAQRLSLKSDEVKRIKLCDQISNVRSVVNDPPLDWDKRKCLEYIQGAKKIFDVSYRVSEYLDKDFILFYTIGIEKYDAKR